MDMVPITFLNEQLFETNKHDKIYIDMHIIASNDQLVIGRNHIKEHYLTRKCRSQFSNENTVSKGETH